MIEHPSAARLNGWFGIRQISKRTLSLVLVLVRRNYIYIYPHGLRQLPTLTLPIREGILLQMQECVPKAHLLYRTSSHRVPCTVRCDRARNKCRLCLQQPFKPALIRALFHMRVFPFSSLVLSSLSFYLANKRKEKKVQIFLFISMWLMY